MEIIEVNSKISDLLFSVDETPGIRYCLFRKENGELIGADDLFNQSGKFALMKSLVNKNTYHVCLYHRSNGDVVRRLKLLKKKQEVKLLTRFKNKWTAFYYRTLFSNSVVQFASYNDYSNTVEISFANGKKIKISLNGLG
jgi:hypothetical protein